MAGDGVGEAKSWLVDYFKQAEGDFFVCTPEEGSKAFYTVSPLRAQQFVIRLCIPMKSKTFWRWISLCGVTTPNGMSIYRRRSTASWCKALLRPFYVLCLPSGLHREKRRGCACAERTDAGTASAAWRAIPSITSVICIKHRKRCRSFIARTIRPTV